MSEKSFSQATHTCMPTSLRSTPGGFRQDSAAEAPDHQTSIGTSEAPVIPVSIGVSDGILHSDSGYASMAKPLSDVSKDPGIRDTPDPTGVVEPGDKYVTTAKDVQSIISDTQDIASLLSSSRTAHQNLAEEVFASALATQLSQRISCEDVLQRVGIDRLQRNLRRSLKLFYLDLCQVAGTNLEKASVQVFRSRNARTRVSREIVEILRTLQDGSVYSNQHMLKSHVDKKALIEDWISKTREHTTKGELGPVDIPNKSVNIDEEATSDSDDESIDQDTGNESVFPHTAEVEAFLFQGQPLQDLTTRINALSLSKDHQPLLRVLLSLPARSSWLESDPPTTGDQLKKFIESHTTETWDWRPFSQTKRNLSLGYTRLNWKCVRNFEKFELWMKLISTALWSHPLARAFNI